MTRPFVQLQSRKGNPAETRSISQPASVEIELGEVLLSIDTFAFTANNVTYAMFGDAMNYWHFFPTGEAAWGMIPVWGFATVAVSRVDGLAVGERFYGYLPMATQVIVQPGRVTPSGFVDAAEHRAALPAIYNQYARCSTDPGYDAAMEGQQMILRPLFFTGFLIDDFLDDNQFFGAERVVLSSASSKTAYATAFCLAQRKNVEVVGLTSPANLDFVRGLGCYHEVLTYDEVSDLSATVSSVYVDFSGNVALRRELHAHLGEALKYSASIGGTDWQNLGKVGELPGPRPTLFFAPSQVKKRIADWGNPTLLGKLGAAWKDFMVPVTRPEQPWLRIVRATGLDASQAAMAEVISGKAKPDEGHVLSL